MTYYELVQFFEENIDSARNDKIIEILNGDLKYTGNVKIRLSNHVVELISIRLNNASDLFTNKLLSNQINLENISMELAELKREINYCHNLSKTKLLEAVSKALGESIYDFVEQVEESFKSILEKTINVELYTIIKQMNLKEGLK